MTSGPDPFSLLSGRATQLVALLAICGGLLGQVNLFIDDILTPGLPSLVYAVTMLAVVAAGLALLLGGDWAAGMARPFVLVGDVVYIVLAMTVVDASLYATPVMLLFSALAAGVLLGPRLLALHCVIVVPAIAVALAGSYPNLGALAVQVAVHSVVLDLTALAIFVLRYRAQRLLEQTRAQSTTDHLTGLPNRRHVVERAPGLIADARRSGQSVAAFLLDLDHFKAVNDTYGHATGDEVLRAAASTLRRVLRDGDIASRIGGEEMLVLAPVHGRMDAYHLAERLHGAMRSADAPVLTTCSIGVSIGQPPPKADAVEWLWQLVAVADEAMYRAKETGRDRWVMAPAERRAQTVVVLPRDVDGHGAGQPGWTWNGQKVARAK